MSPDREDRAPDDEYEDDAEYGEDAPRSIFSTTWFRAIVVVGILAVVAILALPYLEDWVGPTKLSPTVTGPVTVPSPPRVPAAPPIGGQPAPAPPAATPQPASPAAPSAPAPQQTAQSMTPRGASEQRPALPDASRTEAAKTAPSEPARVTSAKPAAAPPVARAAKPAEAPKAPPVKSARAAKAAPPKAKAAAAAGPYWVQVGAFRDEAHAKALVAKLRADDFPAEEIAASGGPAAAEEPAAAEPASAGDRYDVFVSGASSADVNAKLAGKGLSADAVAGGAVIKPSLPLRAAVVLSKDLVAEGMKVQVRRAAAGAAAEKPAPPAAVSGGDALYRVRVGSFPDRAAAEEARKALAAKGFSGFLARGGG